MNERSTFAATWRRLIDAVAGTCDGRVPIVISSLPWSAPLAGAGNCGPVSFVEVPAGRAIALATGLRAALPDAAVVVVMNADSITLGTNHLIHAVRRNVDMTVLLLRSELTAAHGDAPARVDWTLPAYQRALETVPTPLDWATALEAAYVGRATLQRPAELNEVLREATATRGFAVVGITATEHLPTGALSRHPWPEHFAAYRTHAARGRLAGVRDAPARRASGAGHRNVPRVEVRIAGLGGQGIKLAGTVLAEAAGLYHGLWATERGEYGSATRGGPSMVDVVIGSEPITYAGADHADVLVLLSQGAADRHGASGRRGGVVIADGTQVKAPPPGALSLPITELARTHTGSPIAAGVVSLGCVAAIADAVSLESLELSVKEHVPGAYVEANVAACAAGHAAMRAALNGGRDG